MLPRQQMQADGHVGGATGDRAIENVDIERHELDGVIALLALLTTNFAVAQ